MKPMYTVHVLLDDGWEELKNFSTEDEAKEAARERSKRAGVKEARVGAWGAPNSFRSSTFRKGKEL